MARMEVRVSADIEGFGTEIRREGSRRSLEMRAPADLGLSGELVADLESWQQWFDGVVNLCGLERSFGILGDTFDEVGQELAERIALELGPSVRVIYGPQ